MVDSQFSEQFVQLLTENQNRIYGYIYSLLGNFERAADVLQETNLVLWRKNDEFRIGEPFLPWAFAIARFQVLANIRDKKRDRCLLDEELVSALASVVEEESSRLDEHRVALRYCMNKLSEKNLVLLRRRYFGGNSIQQLAVALERGESAIKVALMRIRQSLAACIQDQINKSNS